MISHVPIHWSLIVSLQRLDALHSLTLHVGSDCSLDLLVSLDLRCYCSTNAITLHLSRLDAASRDQATKVSGCLSTRSPLEAVTKRVSRRILFVETRGVVLPHLECSRSALLLLRLLHQLRQGNMRSTQIKVQLVLRLTSKGKAFVDSPHQTTALVLDRRRSSGERRPLAACASKTRTAYTESKHLLLLLLSHELLLELVPPFLHLFVSLLLLLLLNLLYNVVLWQFWDL